MKTIAAVFIIVVLFAQSFAQKRLTDAELEHLKGKVKSVLNEISDPPPTNDKKTVDANQPKFIEGNFYDKNGGLTKNLHYLFGEKTIDTLTTRDNKTLKAARYDPLPDGKRETPQSAAELLASGSPYQTINELEYDARGRIAKQRGYTKKDGLTGTSVYEYNEKGRLVKITSKSSNILNGASVVTFDDRDVETTMVLTGNDAKGADLSMSITYSDYQFDSHGNWTKRTATFKGLLIDSKHKIDKAYLSRTIEYYDD